MVYTNSYADDYNTSEEKYEENFLKLQKNNFITQYGDLTIQDIQIKGLTRTKKHFFLDVARLSFTSKLSEFDPVIFINDINKRGIFTDIKINYKELNGKVIIEIYAKDKWTLIPIPTISSSVNNSSIGLILLETNFLGLNKMLGFGATISNDGNMFLISYADPNIMGSNFTSFFIFKKATQILKNSEWIPKNANTYQEFKTNIDHIFYSLGYKFKPYFLVGTNIGYKKFDIITDYKKILNPPNNTTIVYYGLFATLDLQKYHDYFNYGLFNSLQVTSTKYSSISSKLTYNTYEIKTSYSYKLPSYSRIKLDIKGRISNKMLPMLDQERNGGTTGFISLPSETLLTNDYASVTLTLEKSIYTKPWGIITNSIFWEQGVFNGGFIYDYNNKTYKSITSLNHYYAPGANIQVYFKDIAIPAIGFSYAYNLQSKEGFFKFVAGLDV